MTHTTRAMTRDGARHALHPDSLAVYTERSPFTLFVAADAKATT